MAQLIEQTILIDAPARAVWDALTTVELMKQWMGEPDMELEILTDWNVGSPIVIRGFHHVRFENNGTVLQYDPVELLAYTSRSSLSHLSDIPGHYTTVEFRLTPCAQRTQLALTLSNFPTESILKHLEFYWGTTLVLLKRLIEKRREDAAEPRV